LWIGVIGLSILGLWSLRGELAQAPATLLVRDDIPAKKAPFVVLMMGHVTDRTPHAAKLYFNGWADKILFAEAEYSEAVKLGFEMPDGQATYQYLQRLGVPAKDIIFLRETRNTSSFDEARLLLGYVAAAEPADQRLILVTSWYHSSRAHWIFERMNDYGLTIESYPTPTPDNFWQDEGAFLSVFQEYLKWMYYLIRYGLQEQIPADKPVPADAADVIHPAVSG
jgi:uncharacterized SAM-binding protein YcdF (DUF218 family)